MNAQTLTRIREERGLSKHALARRAGLCVQTVLRAEAGVGEAQALTVEMLARALEVTTEELE